MHFVGIDIGKRFHEASVMDQSGKELSTIKFDNCFEGFEKLISILPAPDESVVGMEGTGHYWLALFSALESHGYQIKVLNPIQTEAHRRGKIRKTKTDKRDSFLIANLLRVDDYNESYVPDAPLHEIRELTRFRFGLVDTIGDLKRQIIAVLDKVFPELESVFSNVFLLSVRELLKTNPLPEEIAQLDLTELAEVLSKQSKGRFGLDKAQELKNSASRSIGITRIQNSAKLQLRLLVEQIEVLEDHVKEIDQNIDDLMQSQTCYLSSIPGISDITAAVMLGEIGDINRFDTPGKLAAFAGIDPSISQSGQYLATNNRMSKRGSPYLRRAIWLAAGVARQHDPELKAFYERKKLEGKHHSTVIGAVARRLLNRVYIVLKEQRPYEVKPKKTLDSI